VSLFVDVRFGSKPDILDWARQCPLWVKSGHRIRSASCPLYPQKRTLLSATGMSAFLGLRPFIMRGRKVPRNFVRNFEGMPHPLQASISEQKYLGHVWRALNADRWCLDVATGRGCRRITIGCYVCTSANSQALLFRYVRLLPRSRWRPYGCT
jgi:hypothetical protein